MRRRHVVITGHRRFQFTYLPRRHFHSETAVLRMRREFSPVHPHTPNSSPY